MRPVVDAHPIRQLVVVGVRVIEEAAFLHYEPTRVHAGPIAAVPAERALADRLLHRLDRQLNVFALLVLAELVVLHPTPAVRADVPAGLADGRGDVGVALERER